MRGVESSGRVEYTPVGHTINLAARLQTIAPAGSMVTSEATESLVEGFFDLRAIGPITVRGIAEPISVYEVMRPGPLRGRFELSARRGFTKFVGRDQELYQMQHALDLAIAERGQVVEVVGEAGAGKSRLLHKFRETLPAECMVLQASSGSFMRTSAYAPVLEFLCKYFGIEGPEAALVRCEKIRTRLAALGSGFNHSLPYLLALFGIQEADDPLAQMDSQVKRRRTLEVIKQILLYESVNHPIVAIFEDLHWIDSETQELLDVLADSIAASRILLVVTYRPEYRHEWKRKPYYSRIRLEALNVDSSEEMLSVLLGDAAELAAVKRFVAERTGGNPFFIEEMVQALFNQGALVRNGTVQVTNLLSQVRLPTTVQGVLASRIDRLSAEQKELIAMLAVIGKESSLGLIQQLIPLADTELDRILARLEEAEFLYQQIAPGEIRYVFKHSLIQEVAYNSLLIERRKQLHEHAAGAIESRYAEQLDDHLGELAHHYRLSGNVLKALEYLGRAGQQAAGRSAHTEASGFFRAALRLLHNLPETPERAQRELALQLALGMSLQVLEGWSTPEIGNVYSRAHELCQQSGAIPHLFPALAGLLAFYVMRGELQTARSLAEQLLSIAEGQGDQELLLRAHSALGFTLIWPGEFALALAHLERSKSLCDSMLQASQGLAHSQLKADILGNLALTLAISGYPDRGADMIRQAIALARKIGLPFSLAMALHLSSVIHAGRGEGDLALSFADEVIHVATAQGFQLLLAYGICWRGVALAVNGNAEQGIITLREGLALVRNTGSETAQTYWLMMMSAGYESLGRTEEGLAIIADALDVVERTGERIAEAELYRLKGELVLGGEAGRSAAAEYEAEKCFRRAIDIARHQRAKSWELRASTSLARLLMKKNRCDEAYATLGQIYGWFSEGFNTGFLKDAKAVLDEVNGS
ncbi:MAG: AAA family ATPase [Deltaproteobacteria bacterium]|nr:AAA family ATPase [Deltaproteobacteria bacterium]